MTYVSIRRSSSDVGILPEKHCRVATKVVFGDLTDLRLSPKRKGTIRMTSLSVLTSSLVVWIFAEKNHRVATNVVFGDWTDL